MALGRRSRYLHLFLRHQRGALGYDTATTNDRLTQHHHSGLHSHDRFTTDIPTSIDRSFGHLGMHSFEGIPDTLVNTRAYGKKCIKIDSKTSQQDFTSAYGNTGHDLYIKDTRVYLAANTVEKPGDSPSSFPIHCAVFPFQFMTVIFISRIPDSPIASDSPSPPSLPPPSPSQLLNIATLLSCPHTTPRPPAPQTSPPSPHSTSHSQTSRTPH